MMFAKQEKDVIFLETVMGLAKQHCHCLVECIPLLHKVGKEAPLYFKKLKMSGASIMQRGLLSEKGLRASIATDFPYFHVGFVHVIDDEVQLESNLCLNVIRGMLGLPQEEMYRRPDT